MGFAASERQAIDAALESLAASDPIFYDVKFVDAKKGWIVGEFGKIMYTENGGETWAEQERTLQMLERWVNQNSGTLTATKASP